MTRPRRRRVCGRRSRPSCSSKIQEILMGFLYESFWMQQQ
jgi:hypothetical protein